MEIGPKSDAPPGICGTAHEISTGGDVRYPHRGHHAPYEKRPGTNSERGGYEETDEL